MYVVVYFAVITTNLSLYVNMLCIRTYYLLNITYYNTYYEALPNNFFFNIPKAFIGPFYGNHLVEIAMATVWTTMQRPVTPPNDATFLYF